MLRMLLEGGRYDSDGEGRLGIDIKSAGGTGGVSLIVEAEALLEKGKEMG